MDLKGGSKEFRIALVFTGVKITKSAVRSIHEQNSLLTGLVGRQDTDLFLAGSQHAEFSSEYKTSVDPDSRV